ncbi:MAG: hypothetical protein Q9186_002416 [Xanthomendoza sp. 1 TL-2023]
MAKMCVMPLFVEWSLIAAICLFLTSLSIAIPTRSNTSLFADETRPICTGDNNWSKGRYDPNDCLQALFKLENTDFKHYRSRDFEFLVPGAKPRTKLDAIRLPRKYTFHTCTLVFAMMSSFSEYPLPGQSRRPMSYGGTDISKFSYLWSIAAWVDAHCIAKSKLLGWCTTGSDFDIGVFIVGTNSEIYQHIMKDLVLTNSSRSGAIDS